MELDLFVTTIPPDPLTRPLMHSWHKFARDRKLPQRKASVCVRCGLEKIEMIEGGYQEWTGVTYYRTPGSDGAFVQALAPRCVGVYPIEVPEWEDTP